MSSCIHQLHFMAEAGRRNIIQGKIQNTDHIHRFQFIVPDFPFNSLFPDRIGSIVNTPVLEKLLLPSLHFYQNLFSFFIFTIDIKDSPAVNLFAAQMLCIQVDDILNDLLAIEQGIQEANKNLFVQVGSKQ